MRVFVVGTGRCGTCTCYQAFRHAANYTAGHESGAGRLDRFGAFPDWHIEVSGQLLVAMPRLIGAYPEAKWIHLLRRREPCVASLAGQCPEDMVFFARQWFLCGADADTLAAAGQFYDLVNESIAMLLPAGRSMSLNIEEAREKWEQVWRFIGAEGDLDASRAEWARAYNPGSARGRDRSIAL